MVSVNISLKKLSTATSLDVGSHKKTQKGVPGLIVTNFFTNEDAKSGIIEFF